MRGQRILGTALLAVVIGTLGCGTDAAAPKSAQDINHRFWDLAINHQAVTLSTFAPYDTVRLIGIALDAFGAPLPQSVQDSAVTVIQTIEGGSVVPDTNIAVDSTGRVRALYPARGLTLLVKTTLQGVTRTKIVLLDITSVAHPPRFASITLSVTPSDTFGRPDLNLAIVATARDTNDQIIDDSIRFSFRVSDSLLQVNQNIIGRGPRLGNGDLHGKVMLYASATVYGVSRSDSLPIIVPYPAGASINILTTFRRGSSTPVPFFSNPVDTVAAGAEVLWVYQGTEVPADVVFDDPSAAEAVPDDFLADFCDPGGHGNISPFVADTTKPCSNQYRIRWFSRVGTYRYHSALSGGQGTLVVMPRSAY